MLARVRNSTFFPTLKVIFVLASGGLLASCATKEEPQLISDNTGRESALPWNKQEKWEGQGQLGNMAERFNTR